jgi:hypothetical protein
VAKISTKFVHQLAVINFVQNILLQFWWDSSDGMCPVRYVWSVAAAGIGQRESVADSGRSAAKAVDTGGRGSRWRRRTMGGSGLQSNFSLVRCGMRAGRGWGKPPGTDAGRQGTGEARMAARAAARVAARAILENPSVARSGLGLVFFFFWLALVPMGIGPRWHSSVISFEQHVYSCKMIRP